MDTPAAALYGLMNFEWVLVHERIEEEASRIRRSLEFDLDRNNMQECIDYIIQYYLHQRLNGFKDIQQIINLFENAQKYQDLSYIMQAYTAETDFYRILNRDLAGDHFDNNGDERYSIARTYILVLLLNYFRRRTAFRDECYRGLKMTDKDLRLYQVGQKILFKSFQSTSSRRDKAESFAKSNTPSETNVLFRFLIKYSPTAIHIGNISQYEHEEEILIYPYSVFEIKTIDKDSNKIYIELEECKTEITID